MPSREFLKEFATILFAGIYGILASTFLAYICVRIYIGYFSLSNFGHKVSKDVEESSLESWEERDS